MQSVRWIDDVPPGGGKQPTIRLRLHKNVWIRAPDPDDRVRIPTLKEVEATPRPRQPDAHATSADGDRLHGEMCLRAALSSDWLFR